MKINAAVGSLLLVAFQCFSQNAVRLDLPGSENLVFNEPAKYEPLVHFDEKTHIIYYVETDRRHVSAIAPGGKLLRHRDPFVEGKLEPYRFAKPIITYIATDFYRSSALHLKVDGGIISEPGPIEYRDDKLGIGFNSSQFGVMDKKTGDFTFSGQD